MLGAPATNAAKRVRVSKTVLECLKRVFFFCVFLFQLNSIFFGPFFVCLEITFSCILGSFAFS